MPGNGRGSACPWRGERPAQQPRGAELRRQSGRTMENCPGTAHQKAAGPQSQLRRGERDLAVRLGPAHSAELRGTAPRLSPGRRGTGRPPGWLMCKSPGKRQKSRARAFQAARCCVTWTGQGTDRTSHCPAVTPGRSPTTRACGRKGLSRAAPAGLGSTPFGFLLFPVSFPPVLWSAHDTGFYFECYRRAEKDLSSAFLGPGELSPGHRLTASFLAFSSTDAAPQRTTGLSVNTI